MPSQNKGLTVRFDPKMREHLELVANQERRTLANQVIVFVAEGLEKYMDDHGLVLWDDGETVTLTKLPA